MSLVRRSIEDMDGYVPGEQPRDKVYVKLNTNENPYPPAPAVSEILHTFDPARLRLYSEPLSRELRDIAASHHGLTSDWVIAGNGSDDLLTIGMRTFVDQGSAVAYPAPSYSLYPVLASLQGAVHRVIDLDSSFDLPADTVRRAGDAALLILCRPNAPTGNSFPLERMHQLCRDFPGAVWIDEAYVDFAEDSCIDFVREYPNVVVSRTLSKSYSLAGIRLGMAFAQPDLIAEMMKVKDSYNVNMLTQALGAAALSDRAYMERNAKRIRTTREALSARLSGLGFDVLPSQTNFVFARPPVPARELFEQLRECGFLVRYFDQERIRDFIRITIGTEEDMARFGEAVAQLLPRLLSTEAREHGA